MEGWKSICVTPLQNNGKASGPGDVVLVFRRVLGPADGAGGVPDPRFEGFVRVIWVLRRAHGKGVSVSQAKACRHSASEMPPEFSLAGRWRAAEVEKCALGLIHVCGRVPPKLRRPGCCRGVRRVGGHLLEECLGLALGEPDDERRALGIPVARERLLRRLRRRDRLRCFCV